MYLRMHTSFAILLHAFTLSLLCVYTGNGATSRAPLAQASLPSWHNSVVKRNWWGLKETITCPRWARCVWRILVYQSTPQMGIYQWMEYGFSGALFSDTSAESKLRTCGLCNKNPEGPSTFCCKNLLVCDGGDTAAMKLCAGRLWFICFSLAD